MSCLALTAPVLPGDAGEHSANHLRSRLTKTIRPPQSYTSRLKRKQIAQWNLPGTTRDYEEDHLISLEIGGAPRSPRNLWPQPWTQARRDDHGIEARLHGKVCDGEMTLRAAERAEVTYKLKRLRNEEAA